EAEIPGINEEDVEVTIATPADRDGSAAALTISAHRDPQTAVDRRILSERQIGRFARVFALPDGYEVDSAQVSLALGVLTVRVPISATPPSSSATRVIRVTSNEAS